MSGIFASLSSASSALSTHGKFVEVAGKNIANLNNPDYVRQRVTTNTIGGNVSGGGVETGSVIAVGVEQVRDRFVDKQIIQEMAYTASLETEDFRLRQILGALGESIDRINDPAYIGDRSEQSGSLRGQIDGFFNAFENFSARPSDTSTKAVLFQAAEGMVDTFNRLNGRLEDLGASLDEEMTTEVAALNERFEELAELNRQVSRMERTGSAGSSSDLRDLRQAKLEEISQFILIETAEVAGSGGQVTVSVRDKDGDPVTLLAPGSDPVGLAYDSSTGSFRAQRTGAELDLQVGRLPSLAKLRTESVSEAQGWIDTLANTIATNVNELYYQAYVPAGADPAVPEMSFFAQPTPPPSVSGVASNVTAASIALYAGSEDPLVLESESLTRASIRASGRGLAGANEVASAIAALGAADFSELGGARMSEFATRAAVALGGEIEDLSNRLEVQRNMEGILKDQRAQTSGVSMDEEVAQMVQFQRAFQASSRVFNVLSEMLETIVTGLR